MKVLVACEYSGTVRDAFLKKGHDALSCDILPTDRSGPHHQGDVLEILDQGWDLMIAHPPCTYLCNSGALRLWNEDGSIKKERFQQMKDGAEFFSKLWKANIPKICVENPIMHRHAMVFIGLQKYTQIIHPYEYGHGETKATCLWLKNLPRLKPTKQMLGRDPKLSNLSPSKERWKLRSKTYQGIADAMAQQWG